MALRRPIRENPRTREIGREVNSFASADRFLGSRNQRKLANNTIVRRLWSDIIQVVLHRTPIVSYYRGDEDVTIDTGGYRSKTTKQRMNQLLEGWAKIYQDRYDWFVTTQKGDFVFLSRRLVITRNGDVGVPPSHDSAPVTWLASSRDNYDPKPDITDSTRSNPGKFDDAFSRAVYLLSLQGTEEEAGDSTDGLWVGLLLDVGKAELLEAALDEEDRREVRGIIKRDGVRFPLQCVITENTQGFVDVDAFSSKQSARNRFNEIEEEIERDYENS